MKIFRRIAGGAAAASFLLLGLAAGPLAAQAATAPTLGSAAPFSAWGKAGVTNNSNVGTTHHWGDVGADAIGNITNLDDATQVDGTIIAPTPAAVQTDISNAYGTLTAQGPGTALDLAGSPTVVPGVYNVAATTMNGTLTLNGPGVYVFLGSATTPIAPGAQMLLTNGATACNVFWAVADSMTIGAGAHMEGTIITNTSLISFGDSASLKGRALSHISQVTMINSQITEPTCVIPSSGGNTGTINVVKHVINDNGGTKTVADFPLFVNGVAVSSGVTSDFAAYGGLYTATETSDANYTRTFSGDCDANGSMNLSKGENRFCIVTNDDIGAPVVVPPVPPLIDVVKVPNPLALPGGPGSVQYTYTLRNIGTVPVTNVTMVGDTCAPIVRVSGDTNGDNKLDVSETWVHTCTTTLTQSHTNTVVATGWANGLTATDIASASVIVGLPIVPPLIHVTKVPNPLTLPVGGGTVTYTKKVSNPGTVALSNVRLTDDMCGPVTYVSGDTNGDAKLDTSETWTYTCSANLTKTTTNTVIALGDANGFTARDFAIATVVVASAVPALPKAGFAPADVVLGWGVVAAAILTASLLLYVARKRQNA